MNKYSLSLLFLLFVFFAKAQDPVRVRVACVGNSITYGAGIDRRFQNSYPAYLQQFMGASYDVRNFGVNGRVMLHRGDYPFIADENYRQLLDFNPDIVVMKLGTNDSKPWNWIYKEDFEGDMTAFIHTLKALPAHPKIYACLPVPAKECPSGITDSVIVDGVIPAIRRVAEREELPIIDLYKSMEPYYPKLFPDKIHPNAEGAAVMAGMIYKELTGNEAPEAHSPQQAFPGRKSEWNGCNRYDFVLAGRDCIVVTPKNPAPGNPWIWRPAFFDAFPPVDKALLEKGFHITYMDLTHLYGTPRAVELGNMFYNTLCHDYGLSNRVVVEGLSRGGYYTFNWAAANPDKVACLYVDAPVCDLTSWPGKQKNPELWDALLKEWDVEDVQSEEGFCGNALCKVNTLVENHIPVMAVCGLADDVVPYSDNFQKVGRAMQERGGIVEQILKPGCGHHPHSLENPEPVVDFILRYQNGYTDTQSIQKRSLLTNAFHRFYEEKKGVVAFLGGSITEMNGWRNMIEEDLKQRFPETEFTFIEAGIASTGSTPHAFRFEKDILQQGTPDLMFFEAVVNDDCNGFDTKAQTRGTEGVIRHALKANPNMDIVMMHFIHDGFLPVLKEGRVPDVIRNHEWVANYYNLPSLNLTQEVWNRMQRGEFSWEEFGGTHPAPLGHRVYTATINRLFDFTALAMPEHKQIAAHPIPEHPLDDFNYEGGHFIPLSEATHLKGFQVQEDWAPKEQIGTREGFVHVPMLTAETSGASFRLSFTGCAVGIFCVSGPHACVLEYRTDHGKWKKLNTATQWSSYLYIPWVYMLETELKNKKHILEVRVAKGDATECQIRNFVVNTK